MNFLAHIYLSGADQQLSIGNFIADAVKGRRYEAYPPQIKKGILLHRAIDSFTDAHPVVRSSTSRLFMNYSHYSGVIIDIYYDHFLAANWQNYSSEPLEEFVSRFYLLLKENLEMLPQQIRSFFPYMVRDNWLLSYASLDGIARILYQMNKRTGEVCGMDKAVQDLEEHYEAFLGEFQQFFPDLENFAAEKIKSL